MVSSERREFQSVVCSNGKNMIVFGAAIAVSIFCCLIPVQATSPSSSSSSSSVMISGSSGAAGTAVSHFEPQVAVLCDGNLPYRPQHMTESGRWQSDPTDGVGCLRDKMEILEYCKRAYPKRDITNIVESGHYLRVGSWCRAGGDTATSQQQQQSMTTTAPKCRTARWVKPFRCLEGPFQSDALLVPEGCLFDHIHNQSRCWMFSKWNVTAATACQERNMQLRSFAMLLPCGISLFSGVEFVCCPRRPAPPPPAPAIQTQTVTQQPAAEEDLDDLDDLTLDDEDEGGDDETDDVLASNASAVGGGDVANAEQDEDDYAGDYVDTDEVEDSGADEEEEDDEEEVSSAAPSPAPAAPPAKSVPDESSTTVQSTPDPYYTHFDPRTEHQSYKDAQRRLEESHREKVTRVMKDWSDLEERYQDMRVSDPHGADSFKQRMTLRFQETVRSLEEEGDAEKHQLAAMHQQRVLAHINGRKREAMVCYTQALGERPSANTHRVQKCLQKLLRALHKDRAHAIAHYRHALASGGPEAGARQRPRTLERLADVDRTVNQSLQMLRRFPDLAARIGRLMDDYMQALRSKDDTPGSLLAMTPDAEAAILDKYRADVTGRKLERERVRQQEKARQKLRSSVASTQTPQTAATTGVTATSEDTSVASRAGPESTSAVNSDTDTAEAIQRAVELSAAAVPHRQQTVRVSHALAHDLGHGEPSYSVRREVYGRKGGRSVYFTLAFAGMALMAAVVVGVAVARRRSARSPLAQGFVEVDQAATPEERHVANMQINGYENPTYKYFEVKE